MEAIQQFKNVKGNCLCGCGMRTKSGSIFRQGHDAKLKSAIINGEFAPKAGKEYAAVMWGLVS